MVLDGDINLHASGRRGLSSERSTSRKFTRYIPVSVASHRFFARSSSTHEITFPGSPLFVVQVAATPLDKQPNPPPAVPIQTRSSSSSYSATTGWPANGVLVEQ